MRSAQTAADERVPRAWQGRLRERLETGRAGVNTGAVPHVELVAGQGARVATVKACTAPGGIVSARNFPGRPRWERGFVSFRVPVRISGSSVQKVQPSICVTNRRIMLMESGGDCSVITNGSIDAIEVSGVFAVARRSSSATSAVGSAGRHRRRTHRPAITTAATV